jgi:uncharacterized repeat protein (TIGR03803 family)
VGNAKDGLTPEGGLIIDQQGNLYGTTTLGGSGPCVLLGSPAGCGIVYELSPPTQKGGPWTETILYNFQGGNDGYFPIGDLAFDKHGNLYGATWFGGGQGTGCNQYYGGNCGTVFKLSPPKQKGGAWTEKVLHSFAGGADGANPNGALVDRKGIVYGLTYSGGNQNCKYDDEVGCGTAFELRPPQKQHALWAERIIHQFDYSSSNGSNPMAGLLLDSNGALYGSTLGGGPGPGGTLFRMSSPRNSKRWKFTILYGFSGNDNGYDPECTLLVDRLGRLYGTTHVGQGGTLHGGVFRLKPPNRKGEGWSLSVLHGFTGGPDGLFPSTSLVSDKQGNIYGTTQQGGSGECAGGCGTVFRLSP